MAPDKETSSLLDEESVELTTGGGIKLDVRPASPADQQLVLDFLRSLDVQDLRFRFLAAVKPSDEIAQLFTRVDHTHVENLLAFDTSDGRLAATAMVAAESSPDTAELAIVIRSDLRYKGIGRALLSYACDVAKARGYQRLECIESNENRDFVTVEGEFGFEARSHPGDPTLTILSKDL